MAHDSNSAARMKSARLTADQPSRVPMHICCVEEGAEVGAQEGAEAEAETGAEGGSDNVPYPV